MLGSAMLTIVESSSSMKTPATTAVSVHHLRAIGTVPSVRGYALDHNVNLNNGQHL
jgi:hypothetical protein